MNKQRSTTLAWVFAIIGIVISPLLLLVEVGSLFLVGMIVAEPTNSFAVKALAVIGLVGLAALAIAFPLVSIIAKSSTGSRVIAGITMVGWLVTQLYVAGIFVGVCSFEGCFPA